MNARGSARRGFLLLATLQLILLLSSSVAHATNGCDSSDPEPQIAAVKGLLCRRAPQYASEFSFSLIPGESGGNDVYSWSSSSSDPSGRISIAGSSGVALSMAVNEYFRTYCNSSLVTWEGTSVLDISTPLPRVQSKRVVSSVPFRYYENVCTVSYSYAWWDWERWEQEIDWMALRGINFPLAFLGQEYIYTEVWSQLGLTDAEIDEWMVGPAYLAWFRMGNIQNFMGPLPLEFMRYQVSLQKQLLARMREFGMNPILTAFAGHVPAALSRVFPSANITQLPVWASMKPEYTETYFLNPADPLFQKIGGLYLQLQEEIYGKNSETGPNYYNTDLFNENLPPSNDPAYLASTTANLYKSIAQVDKSAVWVMQGWLFENQADFWGEAEIKAFLGGVADSEMIVLDLFADVVPVWQKIQTKPVIWCMLNNFGGNHGLYGTVDTVSVGPMRARSGGANLVGVGLTMEGIEQNPAMYDLAISTAWTTTPIDLSQWSSSYVQYRYGSSVTEAVEGWNLLLGSVYNCTDGHHNHDHSVVVSRPSLSVSPDTWYNPSDVRHALDLLMSPSSLSAFSSNPLYLYDVVDVTRQVLRDISNQAYVKLIEAYHSNDYSNATMASEYLIQTLTDMNTVLNTNEYFWLGTWIENARSMAERVGTPGFEGYYETNARNQITVWGAKGYSTHLHDYASKHWAGLVDGYYIPRWEMFNSYLLDAMAAGQPFNDDLFLSSVRDLEEKFVASSIDPAPINKGNTLAVVNSMRKKYKF